MLCILLSFSFTYSSATEIYTLSLHDALPILNDLAVVSLETEDATADTWKNGSSDVLMVQIARAEDVSQKAMTTAVRDEISEVKSAGLGTDMTLNEVIAHADFVDDAMGDVTKNISSGGIIAIVILRAEGR